MRHKRLAILLSLWALALVVPLGGMSCSAPREDLPTLVFFRSDTCPYCKQMTPIVEGIRNTYRGELNVIVATLEEEKGRNLADQYGIVGFPVVLLLDRDGERVSRMQGVVPQPTLEQAVEKLIHPDK